MAPGPAASSPGNLLEMQILMPHPRPAEYKTLGGAAQQTALQGSLMHAQVWNHWPSAVGRVVRGGDGQGSVGSCERLPEASSSALGLGSGWIFLGS